MSNAKKLLIFAVGAWCGMKYLGKGLWIAYCRQNISDKV